MDESNPFATPSASLEVDPAPFEREALVSRRAVVWAFLRFPTFRLLGFFFLGSILLGVLMGLGLDPGLAQLARSGLILGLVVYGLIRLVVSAAPYPRRQTVRLDERGLTVEVEEVGRSVEWRQIKSWYADGRMFMVRTFGRIVVIPKAELTEQEVQTVERLFRQHLRRRRPYLYMLILWGLLLAMFWGIYHIVATSHGPM